MTDAPERIWAQDADPRECNYTGGGWWDEKCGNTQYPHIVEYLRADLAKPKVKPLEWHKSHLSGWNGDWHTVPTNYTIRCADENGWKWTSSTGAFGYCGTDEAAKAVAQADYERRILEALE